MTTALLYHCCNNQEIIVPYVEYGRLLMKHRYLLEKKIPVGAVLPELCKTKHISEREQEEIMQLWSFSARWDRILNKMQTQEAASAVILETVRHLDPTVYREILEEGPEDIFRETELKIPVYQYNIGVDRPLLLRIGENTNYMQIIDYSDEISLPSRRLSIPLKRWFNMCNKLEIVDPLDEIKDGYTMPDFTICVGGQTYVTICSGYTDEMTFDPPESEIKIIIGNWFCNTQGAMLPCLPQVKLSLKEFFNMIDQSKAVRAKTNEYNFYNGVKIEI